MIPKARPSATTNQPSRAVRGIEGAERELWLRPIPEQHEGTDPLIADVDLLNLVDASKLVRERVPLTLLVDLLAPSTAASERILRDER